LLAQGLVARMRRKLFTWFGLKVVAVFMIVGTVDIAVTLMRWFVRAVSLVTPRSLSTQFERFDIRSPLHRFASRTSLLEAVLDDLLFKGASLNICRQSRTSSSTRQSSGPARRSASARRSRVRGAGVSCKRTM
jgi:NTE family protein